MSAADSARLGRWKTISLAMGIAAQLFLAGDWYGFAAVSQFVAADLALSPFQVGMVQGSFSITYALGMIFWGALGQRLSTRVLYCAGLVGVGLSMLVQTQAQSYEALVATRLAVGFFDAAVWIGAARLIIVWFPPAQRGRALSALLAAFSLAITLDFALGIPLAEAIGWRGFFMVLAISTLVVALLGLLLVKNERTAVGLPRFSWDDEVLGGGAMPSLWTIFQSRWFYIAALAIFGDMFAVSATATWVVPALIQTQGIEAHTAATVGTLMGLSQVVLLLIGGHISDLLRRRVLMLKIGAALSLLSGLSLLLTVKYGLPHGGLLLVAAFSGVVVFSGGAIFALISEKYGERLGGSAIGYAEMVGISSTFVAPALLGAVIQSTGSFVAAFGTFVAVQLVILLALLLCSDERAGSLQPRFTPERSGA
ncbi:putative major facilitator superfamily transporter [Metapseudomonas resinovorans NBRC 106553]|uniref:Putative major facilitator superfamily transporter n=1 Tax=Metapseudomonas resinovorans NBRC 106553 TaxID=1245471 RepID=S6BDW0_METRE|nr:putative major facilitator superfamily transporter [Pseudomonas resinovorans NBRC 106553]